MSDSIAGVPPRQWRGWAKRYEFATHGRPVVYSVEVPNSYQCAVVPCPPDSVVLVLSKEEADEFGEEVKYASERLKKSALVGKLRAAQQEVSK